MKQLTLIILLISIFHINSLTQPKSIKRGIAADITGISDLKALSPCISWFYNWSQYPASNVLNYLGDEKVQYIPMIWNGTQSSIDAASLYYQTDPEIGYLLGFNEPNFADQANMTPSAAAAFWPKLEILANTYNLKLVAPAVNYSGGIYDPKYDKTLYSDPYSWLDTFFMECNNCKVDYIAVHWYGHGGLETIVNNMWEKYHLPVWVTEFASWDASVNPMTLELEKDFMIKYVDWLENNQHVYRYAWFTGRASNNDFIDLLGTTGKLTELGEIYLKMPVHDTTYFQEVPAKIEAENYSAMSGIQLQTTNDVDGFLNVGWIDTEDYLDYNISMAETQTVPIKIRYSAIKNTQISVLENGLELLLLNLSSTGSYTAWQTNSTTIELQQGNHTLRFYAKNNGFNLNWLQFGEVVSGVENLKNNNCSFKIISNPVQDGTIKVSAIGDYKFKGQLNYEIAALDGKVIQISNLQISDKLNSTIEIPLNRKLKPGAYFLRIKDNVSATTLKFMVSD
ncbi:MAG: glycosyl hydrolase [Bacteroidales bacterium]